MLMFFLQHLGDDAMHISYHSLLCEGSVRELAGIAEF